MDGIPRIPSSSPGTHSCTGRSTPAPFPEAASACGPAALLPDPVSQQRAPCLPACPVLPPLCRPSRAHRGNCISESERLELWQDAALRAAGVRLQELGSRLPHAWAIASAPLPSFPPHLVTAVHPPPASLCPGMRQPNMGVPASPPNPEAQCKVHGSLPACTPLGSCDRAQETAQGHTVY